jgi:Fur family transcriptional regulator, ferric uptake regulator
LIRKSHIMCRNCDYTRLLEESGLGYTAHRHRVLEVIGNNSPLSAQQIFETLKRTDDINLVTVYRILDLLVEKGLVNRFSGGGRSFVYGLAPNENHPAHPHFYCMTCGNMECLNPDSLKVDLLPLQRTFPGLIEGIEIRVDGVCKNCLRTEKRLS